jgi:hypothetical protein
MYNFEFLLFVLLLLNFQLMICIFVVKHIPFFDLNI